MTEFFYFPTRDTIVSLHWTCSHANKKSLYFISNIYQMFQLSISEDLNHFHDFSHINNIFMR